MDWPAWRWCAILGTRIFFISRSPRKSKRASAANRSQRARESHDARSRMNPAENKFCELARNGLVVMNPAWAGMPGLIHGITTRAALPQPGKADFFDVMARAREAGVFPR